MRVAGGLRHRGATQLGLVFLCALLVATEFSWTLLPQGGLMRLAAMGASILGLSATSLLLSAPRKPLPYPAKFLAAWALWGLIASNWGTGVSALVVSLGIVAMVWAGLRLVELVEFTQIIRSLRNAIIGFLIVGVAYEIFTGVLFVERFRGVGHGPTDAGRLAGLALLSTAALPVRWRAKVAPIGFCFSVLFVADSRMALVGTVVGLFALSRPLLTGRLQLVSPIFYGGLVVGLALLFSGFGAGTVEQVSTRDGGVTISSLTGRTALWDLVLEKAPAAPIFGHGSGSSIQIFFDGMLDGKYPWLATNAHNAALQALLEHGVIGLTLLLLAIASALVRSRVPAITAILSLLIVNSITEAMFHEPAAAVAFLIVAVGGASQETVALAPPERALPNWVAA